MPKFEITPTCHEAVVAAAEWPFNDTSVRLPNGNREVWVGPETYARLEEIAFPGETLSDVVERLCVALKGPLS
jgi:hypothetical protein